MTRTASAIAILLVAGMTPFLIGARDSLDDSRQRLAAMTSAQRKEIERNREKYDKLTSLEKLELREFSKALRDLPAAERTELESVMGRLAAWVETFPDDVRTKYFAALPTDRLAILKEQLTAWKRREGMIVAQLNKAEMEAKKFEPAPMNPAQMRMKMFERTDKLVQQMGTPDDKAVWNLSQKSERLNPIDKSIVTACMSSKLGFKPLQGKGGGGRRELEQAPIALLRQCSFVPAFARLPSSPRGLPDSNRKDLVATLLQIYLLKPPSTGLNGEQVMSRLDIPREIQPGPLTSPVYLLQNLALLKDYAEGKKSVPLADIERVNQLLERRK